MLKRYFFAGFSLAISGLFLSGCSFEETRKGVVGFFNNGKEKIEEVVGNKDENLNPDFSDAKESVIELETASEIDRYLKANFKKVFGGSKIIETGQLHNTPFTFQYVMKNKFKPSDIDPLLSKFLDTASLAKEDSPLVQDDKKAIGQFGLYHNFGGRRYVLDFLFDYDKQLVWVNIY